jgi:hypothetical protein
MAAFFSIRFAPRDLDDVVAFLGARKIAAKSYALPQVTTREAGGCDVSWDKNILELHEEQEGRQLPVPGCALEPR